MTNNTLGLSGVLEGYGKLFYIIDPATHSFQKLEGVPDYVQQAMPFMVTMILLEEGLAQRLTQE